MGTDYKQRLFTATFITCLVVLAFSPSVIVQSQAIPINNLNIGPYVERVAYDIIVGEGQTILSLLADDIQFSSTPISTAFLSVLENDTDISLSNSYRNGYGHITINCDKYPFNISAFRRAFAHAFDKTQVNAQLQGVGIIYQVHESVVHYANVWCIEDDLPYHYYTAQIATGAEILDNAGFIDSGSGYRLAPDGSSFSVNIQWTDMTPIATAVGCIVSQAAVNALTALGVNTTSWSIMLTTFQILISPGLDITSGVT